MPSSSMAGSAMALLSRTVVTGEVEDLLGPVHRGIRDAGREAAEVSTGVPVNSPVALTVTITCPEVGLENVREAPARAGGARNR